MKSACAVYLAGASFHLMLSEQCICSCMLYGATALQPRALKLLHPFYLQARAIITDDFVGANDLNGGNPADFIDGGLAVHQVMEGCPAIGIMHEEILICPACWCPGSYPR
jgi:hypothetical protein